MTQAADSPSHIRADQQDWPSSEIRVSVPAHPDLVTAIRAMTRSAAALSDLDADDVEDLQIAVAEAAALLLPLVDPAGDRNLSATFRIEPARLGVTVSALCTPGAAVDRGALAWLMLTALDDQATVDEDAGALSITIGRARGHLRG